MTLPRTPHTHSTSFSLSLSRFVCLHYLLCVLSSLSSFTKLDLTGDLSFSLFFFRFQLALPFVRFLCHQSLLYVLLVTIWFFANSRFLISQRPKFRSESSFSPSSLFPLTTSLPNSFRMSAPPSAPSVSSRFVSSKELEAASQKRQEEWKAAYERIGQEPPKQDEGEGTYDPRSLWEKLQENKVSYITICTWS